MKKSLILIIPFLFLFACYSYGQESTKYASGKISMLRVNEVNINYGPPTDNIAAEVIVSITGDKNAYGFQLRKDENEIARQGMLALLRDAYANAWTVKLTHLIKNGSTKGRIIVVELSR